MSFLPAIDRTLPAGVQATLKERLYYEQNDAIDYENKRIANYGLQ